MRYVILGAGAIGGAIGGRLAAAGFDVTLVARGRHLEAMAAGGLELRTPEGAARISVRAVPDAAGSLRPGDAVILAVKSQDTAAALAQLVAGGVRDLAVFCAQNGVDNERQALRHFRAVYGVHVIVPATHLEPGVVELARGEPLGVLDLGCYPTGVDATAEAVAADLRRVGFTSDVHADIMTHKYRKLLSNLSNVLDAASGVEARTGPLAVAAHDEALECLAAVGIELGPEDGRAPRWGSPQAAGTGARPTFGHLSSSRQSLVRGTGSLETDWLNGEIVLLGRLHGVPTPVNEVLLDLGDRLLAERPVPGSLPLEELEAWVAARGVTAGAVD